MPGGMCASPTCRIKNATWNLWKPPLKNATNALDSGAEQAAGERVPQRAIQGETCRPGRACFLVDRPEYGSFRMVKVVIEELSWFVSADVALSPWSPFFALGCGVGVCGSLEHIRRS